MNLRATPLPPHDGQAAWLIRLVEATAPNEVAAVIAAFAQALAGCRDATVAWTSSGLPRAYRSGGAPDHARIGRAQARLGLRSEERRVGKEWRARGAAGR